jgi:segregation and condensation protein A
MTVAAPEASALAATAPPVSREAAEQVLTYLLWNKAMIGETVGPSLVLDRYMALVRDLKEGVHLVIQDPFQKATALLFELVLSEEFNPWEIDLVKFTQLYLERLRQSGDVDFGVAGRLIYMAWNILVLQSEEVLTNRTAEMHPPEPSPEAFDLPPDQGYLGALDDPTALDVTHTLLTAGEPPFEAMVRHCETRPVSLMELARAFQEAEEQARRSLEIQKARERLRQAQRAAGEVLVHGDIPEGELAAAWDTIRAHALHEKFALETLWSKEDSRERVVSLFIALLFLAQEGVLRLSQDSPGAGPVWLERIAENRPAAGAVASPET